MDRERLIDVLEQALLDLSIRSAGVVYAAPAYDDKITLDGDFDLGAVADEILRSFPPENGSL